MYKHEPSQIKYKKSLLVKVDDRNKQNVLYKYLNTIKT